MDLSTNRFSPRGRGKKLSVVLVFLGLLGCFPHPSLASDRLPFDPRVLVKCRLNRLTDIVFSGKITKVVMSDSSSDDFRLVGAKVGGENHLILEPLKKGAASDLFIYGPNRVSYLKVRTVPDAQSYDLRFDPKGNRKVLSP